MTRKLPPVDTRFKKGQSGNPGGCPKMSPEAKAARKLTQSRFAELASTCLNLTKEQLAQKIQDPKTTALDLMIMKVIQHSINKGDQMRLSFILDRLIGKVPTIVDLDVNPATIETIKEFQSKTTEELLAILKGVTLDSESE